MKLLNKKARVEKGQVPRESLKVRVGIKQTFHHLRLMAGYFVQINDFKIDFFPNKYVLVH